MNAYSGVAGATGSLESLLQILLIAHQNQGDFIIMGAQETQRSGYHDLGTEISAHGVQCNGMACGH